MTWNPSSDPRQIQGTLLEKGTGDSTCDQVGSASHGGVHQAPDLPAPYTTGGDTHGGLHLVLDGGRVMACWEAGRALQSPAQHQGIPNSATHQFHPCQASNAGMYTSISMKQMIFCSINVLFTLSLFQERTLKNSWASYWTCVMCRWHS